MWRQKASAVVFPDDVETIRNDLEQGCNRDGTQVCLKTFLLKWRYLLLFHITL
jgi:hypothetical protein